MRDLISGVGGGVHVTEGEQDVHATGMLPERCMDVDPRYHLERQL